MLIAHTVMLKKGMSFKEVLERNDCPNESEVI